MIVNDSVGRSVSLAVLGDSTVVVEYVSEVCDGRDYQSEADLERELLDILVGQSYQYLECSSETVLVDNLRVQHYLIMHKFL